MSITIKSCTKCWREYTLEMWTLLPLTAVDEGDGAETRPCECGRVMVVDVRHLATLELRTPDEKMRAAKAMISAARWRGRFRRARPWAFATLMASLLVVVFVLWRA